MARIFVVDDQPECLVLIETLLERRGHEVFGFASAEEALAAYDSAPPELLITDLYMPGKDGLELLMELRRRKARPALLAVSGADLSVLATQGVVGAARSLGADLLMKPFKGEELIERVGELLGSPVLQKTRGKTVRPDPYTS